MTVEDVIDVALTAGRLARTIGQRFELDEEKLERAGFTTEEIDRIFLAVEN